MLVSMVTRLSSRAARQHAARRYTRHHCNWLEPLIRGRLQCHFGMPRGCSLQKTVRTPAAHPACADPSVS